MSESDKERPSLCEKCEKWANDSGKCLSVSLNLSFSHYFSFISTLFLISSYYFNFLCHLFPLHFQQSLIYLPFLFFWRLYFLWTADDDHSDIGAISRWTNVWGKAGNSIEFEEGEKKRMKLEIIRKLWGEKDERGINWEI